MPRFNRKASQRAPRRTRPTLESAPAVDFSPLLPFLRERVGETHPIYDAATTGNLSAFMAALRDCGDSTLNHEIATELERTPLQQA